MSGLSSLSDVALLKRMLAAVRQGGVTTRERRAFDAAARARGPLRMDSARRQVGATREAARAQLQRASPTEGFQP